MKYLLFAFAIMVSVTACNRDEDRTDIGTGAQEESVAPQTTPAPAGDSHLDSDTDMGAGSVDSDLESDTDMGSGAAPEGAYDEDLDSAPIDRGTGMGSGTSVDDEQIEGQGQSNPENENLDSGSSSPGSQPVQP